MNEFEWSQHLLWIIEGICLGIISALGLAGRFINRDSSYCAPLISKYFLYHLKKYLIKSNKVLQSNQMISRNVCFECKNKVWNFSETSLTKYSSGAVVASFAINKSLNPFYLNHNSPKTRTSILLRMREILHFLTLIQRENVKNLSFIGKLFLGMKNPCFLYFDANNLCNHS